MDPQSENAKRLHAILTSWMENKASEPALDKFKRAFIGLSTDIENEDSFLAVLYGQGLLDESPLNLSQRIPKAFLRVQYGIEISLGKECLQELVVALDRSKNDTFLSQILKWAKKNFVSVQEVGKIPSLDLAPQKLQRSKPLSALTPASAAPRHRKIEWSSGLERSVLEICKKKIILGWKNCGQIKMYDSVDLSVQTMLNYCADHAGVTCLQCTCTELIAGYDDGNICVWDIAKGITKHTFTNQDAYDESQHPTCMRWRDPKLVVGTNKGRVYIWQYVGSSFTRLGSWDSNERYLHHVEFNESYVIIHSAVASIEVKYLNGYPCHAIHSAGYILCNSFYADRIFTGGRTKAVEVWDVNTGAFLLDLKEHEEEIHAIDVEDDVIASVDNSGKIILWSAKAAVEGRQAKLTSFRRPKLDADDECIDIKLGKALLVIGSRNARSTSVVVMDFPS